MNNVRFTCLTYRVKNPLMCKIGLLFHLTYIDQQRLFSFVLMIHYIEYMINYSMTYTINYLFT